MFSMEQPRLMRNGQPVSKPAAAANGPAMAAPNQKAVQANNDNRRPLGDIGNLVGGLNAQCSITNDYDVRKYYEYKMAGPAMAAPKQKAVQSNNNNRRALRNIGNLVGGVNAQSSIPNDVRKYHAYKMAGPAMAATNQKAVQANNNNRRALGNIGNLEGGLNAQSSITNDDTRKYSTYKMAGPTMAAANQKAMQANNHNRRALRNIGNLEGGLNDQSSITNDDARKYCAYKMAGPAMAAANQKAMQANNHNRRALGDTGNLAGGLNAQCNITNDDARRYRANLVVNANKGASSSTQQSQGGGIVARVEEKARAGVVWGNKQSPTIRTKAPYATATQSNSAISISDSIYSSAPDGGLKTPYQLKAKKPQSATATLLARSEDSFRDVCDVLPSIDDGDLDNQLAVVEYVEDIYKFYRKIENMSCVPPDYMRRQFEIKENMRAVLIDWLLEVHLKFGLMPETLYLTVNIIDRYLSIQSVTRKELQLVGVTAMLIASKYEEIWALKVSDLVEISGDACTSKHIVEMERIILNKLKFNLTVPTPYVFVLRFLKAAGADKTMENLAFFFVDLCLLHYTMIKYCPSMLAAAAVYTAQCTLKKRPCWSKTLIFHTGYSEADLKECAHFMVDFHLNAKGNKQQSVHKKYSKQSFGSVASLSPANIPLGTVVAPATNKCAHQTYFRGLYEGCQ